MQAEVEAPVKPGQAARDQRGRVNLDDLTENDLDYGSDERGLARLRRRLTRIVYKFNGESPARHCLARSFGHWSIERVSAWQTLASVTTGSWIRGQ